MSPQSRSLLAILAMAIVGVVALGYLANRYTKIARTTGPAIEQALQRVDAFIVVRRAIRLEIESIGERAPHEDSLRRVRDGALTDSGMDPAQYAEIRTLYRKWRSGRLHGGMPMARAMERRKAELSQLDLGAYELLDS